jgi:hypothetical protein
MAIALVAATGAFGPREVVREPLQSLPTAVVPLPSRGPETDGGPANAETPRENRADRTTATEANGEEVVPPPSDGSVSPKGGSSSDNAEASNTENGPDSTDPGEKHGDNGTASSEPEEMAEAVKSTQPDSDAISSARQRLKALVAEESAQRLIALAEERAESDTDTYVLLSLAKESAAATGDVQTALAAIDRLEARFEVDAFDLKTELVTQLGRNGNEETTYRELAELALELADEAANRGRNGLARDLTTKALVAARRSGNSDLVRKATLAIVQLQQL